MSLDSETTAWLKKQGVNDRLHEITGGAIDLSKRSMPDVHALIEAAAKPPKSKFDPYGDDDDDEEDEIEPAPSVTVTLAIPCRDLSPNGRAHWRKKHAAFKSYKQAAHILAMAECNTRPEWARAVTDIVWYYQQEQPDPDNALAWLKAAFDGFQGAGIIADDKGLDHNRIVFRAASKANPPRVEITITREGE